MMAQAGLCEKPADPKLKTEMDAKLFQMQAERSRQDQMWCTTTSPSENSVSVSNGTSTLIRGNPK